MKNIMEPSQMLFCYICEKDVTNITHAVCDIAKVHVCLKCFASGKEKRDFKKGQPYRIIHNLNAELFSKGWSAHEELLLLEGLQTSGFGNWTDIAKLIGGKNREQCELHYLNFWTKNFDELKDAEINIAKDAGSKQKFDWKSVRRATEGLVKAYKEGEDEQKSLIEQKLQRYKDKIEKSRQANQKNENSFNDILGYMPLRGDFDVEYDNEAELFLAEMEFMEGDDATEIDLKKKILEIYNKRLDERVKRKNFVIERGLLDLKKQNHLERSRSSEEKEIYNLMKIFARFQTEDEHERLVQNIVKERNLRRRIEELKAYKELNLKTFEEVEQFLAEKRKKDEQYNKRTETLKNIYQQETKFNKRTSRMNKDEEEFKDTKASFTENENKLCDKVGLKPHEYLLIKEILVRESVSQGFLSKEYVNQVFDSKRTEKHKIMEVFDFLVTHDLVLER